jgi:hypothetical protein
MLAEIFSPFRLPIELTLKTVGCEGVGNAYYQRPEVRICYEYLDEIRQSVPQVTIEAGVSRTDAVLGQFFYVVAHEMGHAVFDLLDVPLFGGLEDAADQLAAYMMLQFGKTDARRLVGGAAYSYKHFVQDPQIRGAAGSLFQRTRRAGAAVLQSALLGPRGGPQAVRGCRRKRVPAAEAGRYL